MFRANGSLWCKDALCFSITFLDSRSSHVTASPPLVSSNSLSLIQPFQVLTVVLSSLGRGACLPNKYDAVRISDPLLSFFENFAFPEP